MNGTQDNTFLRLKDLKFNQYCLILINLVHEIIILNALLIMITKPSTRSDNMNISYINLDDE